LQKTRKNCHPWLLDCRVPSADGLLQAYSPFMFSIFAFFWVTFLVLMQKSLSRVQLNYKIASSYFIIIFLLTNNSFASEFDPCTDIIIDQTTHIAYGAHGAPFDGDITCYQNKQPSLATTKRSFKKGIATGQHFCFDSSGKPKWVLVYLNGKRWKMDVFKNRFNQPKDSNLPTNYRFTACNASDWTQDWCDKANFKDCLAD